VAREVAISLDPVPYALLSSLLFLRRRASLDLGYSAPVPAPPELEAEEADPRFALVASVEAAEAANPCLLRRYGQVELCQPLRQLSIEGVCISLVLEGADEVVRVAADNRPPCTSGFHDFLEPEVEGIVKVDVGQDGTDNAALRAARFRVEDLSVCVEYADFQPFADQAQEGFVIHTLL